MASGVASIKITGNVTEALAALDALGIKAEETGLKTEEAFGDKIEGKLSGLSGSLGKLGNLFGSVGLPGGEAFSKMGEKIEGADTKGKKFGQTLSAIGQTALMAGVAGFAVIGAESIKLGESYQQSTAKLAASADISQQAATKIGKAFLDTAGTSTFSGQEIMTAYSGVAGQLGTVQGHALTAAQAMQVMRAATDLAEASGGNLTSTTSALASVMQAYGLKTTDASNASDALFNSARLTGNTVSSVASTVAKLKTNLGAVAPSLGDTASLMVDLTEHGETGRAAMSAVNSAFSTLLKTTAPTIQAAKDLTSVHTALTKATIGVSDATIKLGEAQAAESKSPSVANVDKLKLAQNALTSAQLAAADAQDKLNQATAAAPAKLTASQVELKSLGVSIYSASGQFVGMSSVISQLQPKLEHMTQAQQMATTTALFGAPAARKLLDTILAGPAAYDKAAAAVTRSGSAQDAAEMQAKTLHGQMEMMKSTVEDLGTKLGLVLIPKLELLGTKVAEVITWFEKHKSVAQALAIVIGGALTVAVGSYVASLAKIAASGAVDAIKGLAGGFKVLTGAELDADAAADANPFGAILLAATALGVGIYELVKHWNTVWADIKKVFDDAVKFLRSGFGTLALLITGPFAPLLFLALHWQQIWGDIKKWSSDAWQFLDGIWQGIVKGVEGLYHSVTKFFTRMWHDAETTVYTGVMTVVRFFSNLPGLIWKGIGDLADGFYDFGKKLIKKLIDGIKSAPHAVVSAIEGLIPGGGLAHKALGVIGLASGGYVNKPTLAVIGEGGEGEYVIPESMFRGADLSGSGVTPGLMPKPISGVGSNVMPLSGYGGLGATAAAVPTTIVLELDKQVVGRALWPTIRTAALQTTGRNAVKVGLG